MGWEAEARDHKKGTKRRDGCTVWWPEGWHHQTMICKQTEWQRSSIYRKHVIWKLLWQQCVSEVILPALRAGGLQPQIPTPSQSIKYWHSREREGFYVETCIQSISCDLVWCLIQQRLNPSQCYTLQALQPWFWYKIILEPWGVRISYMINLTCLRHVSILCIPLLHIDLQTHFVGLFLCAYYFVQMQLEYSWEEVDS